MLSGKTLHCHHFDKTGPYTSHLAYAGVMAIRPLSKNGTKRKYVFFFVISTVKIIGLHCYW